MTIRFFLLPRRIVAEGRISSSLDPESVNYPVSSFSDSSGSLSAARAGQLLTMGTSARSDDLGRQRVYADGSNPFQIPRTPQGRDDGQLDFQPGAYVTVYDDYRVWPKIPWYDGSKFLKDSYVEPEEMFNPRPIANGGPGFAATIDAGTGRITVALSGAASRQFDPSASSSLTQPSVFAWELGDGAFVTGSATSRDIVATFPAGFRWVRLTVTSVTSTSANRGHTCYIPIYARDPENDLCLLHQIVDHRMDLQGQRLQIKILQDAPRDNYLDGTLAMIWEDEPSSPSDRDHMLFIGWQGGESSELRGNETGTLMGQTFVLLDVAGRLQELPGFAQVVQACSDISWECTIYPNMFYYVWYLLYWHSTALEVADLLLGTSTLNSFAFYLLASDEGALYVQVNDLCELVSPDHHLTCTRRGQLFIGVDPQILSVPLRDPTYAETVFGFEYNEVQVSYQRAALCHELTTYAYLSNAAALEDVVAARIPNPAGFGLNRRELRGRYTISQESLFISEGNRFARMNARFGAFAITIPYHLLSRAYDPAFLRWLRVEMARDASRLRPFGFEQFERGIVLEMDIHYEYSATGLVRSVRLLWELESSGPKAQLYVPPVTARLRAYVPQISAIGADNLGRNKDTQGVPE